MQDRVTLSSGAQVDAQLVDCSAYVFGAVHISSGEMTSCFHVNTPEEAEALAQALSDLGKRMRGHRHSDPLHAALAADEVSA